MHDGTVGVRQSCNGKTHDLEVKRIDAPDHVRECARARALFGGGDFGSIEEPAFSFAADRAHNLRNTVIDRIMARRWRTIRAPVMVWLGTAFVRGTMRAKEFSTCARR
jgi:hypothetical protein